MYLSHYLHHWSHYPSTPSLSSTHTSRGYPNPRLTTPLVHTRFNVIGVLVVYPIPALRNIPIRLARSLAIRAQRNPLWVGIYVLGVFVMTPFLGYLLLRTTS